MLSHQGLVIARFNNAPMIHDNDLLGIANRRQTMGHDKTGPILPNIVHGILNQRLGSGIN